MTTNSKSDAPRRADESVCKHCGVTTTAWPEMHLREKVIRSRSYYPVSFVVRLKPDTKTTYIVEPNLETHLKSQPFYRIRSMNEGKLEYIIDVDLPKDLTIVKLLDDDMRIESWHTKASAPVCEFHGDFVDKRW